MSTNSEQILLKAKDIEVGFPIIEGFVQAVRGVSFEIIQGKTLALVGESGSGKSVTARALMGMLSERAVVGKSASVEFSGQQLIGLSEEQLQKIRGSAISMIFQEPMTSLNPLYTVGNQIIESIQAHRKMPKKEARSEALRLLQEVQIPNPEARLDQYPHQLSGGQRQRVMIALAIANEPKLLIADEPTTALDVTIQAQILRLIKDLQVKYGMSVLLITHDLNVVRKTSEQICVMRNGEIVERGLTEEVFTNPQHPYTKHLIQSEPKGAPLHFKVNHQLACKVIRYGWSSRSVMEVFSTEKLRTWLQSMMSVSRFGKANQLGSSVSQDLEKQLLAWHSFD